LENYIDTQVADLGEAFDIAQTWSATWRKSLITQQILMYKTAVYTVVNGGDIAQQYIDA